MNEHLNKSDKLVIETFLRYFEKVGTAEERFSLWAHINLSSKDRLGDDSVYKKDNNDYQTLYKSYNTTQKSNIDNFFNIYKLMNMGDQTIILKLFSQSMRLTKYGDSIKKLYNV